VNMVKVRVAEGRFSLYCRRDGALGIMNPDTKAPATNLEVLGLEYSEDSDKPYWTRGLNARLIAERHVAQLNDARGTRNE
jgi:hypothetical protein